MNSYENQKQKLFGIEKVLYDSPHIKISYKQKTIYLFDKDEKKTVFTKEPFDSYNRTNKKYQLFSFVWEIIENYNSNEIKRLKTKWNNYINDTKKHLKKDVFEELVKKVWHPSRFHIWKNYDVDLEELEN